MTIRVFGRTAVLFAFALFVLDVGSLRADPLVVTSGFFSVDEGDPINFHFVGDDFDLRAFPSFSGPSAPLFTFGPLQTCHVCAPGTSIDLNSRGTGAIGEWVNRPDIPNLFQGTAYSTVYFSGDLRFDAPTLTAPAITRQIEVVDLIAPFHFSGQLTGYATPDRTGNALFSLMLTGRGNADVALGTSSPGDPPAWFLEGLDYRFTSADVSPTPEPATLMFVAAGLLTAGAATRRRFRRQRNAA
jgi:hypothetical protein